MRSIGLLGGTFNPIHFGHLRLAEEISEHLALDEMRLIPASVPPHKVAPQVSAKHRANMVNLAIQNNQKFVLEDCELQREGASYTIDTLIDLRKKLGKEISLYLVMGSDAFAYFDTWYRWQEILNYCHIVLVQRPNHENAVENFSNSMKHFYHARYKENLQDLQKCSGGFITTQTITPLAISSTDIRERLNNKKSVRYLLPQTVLEYIEKHHLYR